MFIETGVHVTAKCFEVSFRSSGAQAHSSLAEAINILLLTELKRSLGLCRASG